MVIDDHISLKRESVGIYLGSSFSFMGVLGVVNPSLESSIGIYEKKRRK